GTGKEQTVKIEQSSGLSDDEINRMKEDAESHAEDDKKKRELVEARNQADSLCYQIEKTIKEQGDKLSEADKAPIEAAVKKVREASEGDDPAAIKTAVEELQQASHAMSEAMYKSAAEATSGDAGAAGEAAEASTKSDDDAIDAEFEVKS
ncbi:MAG: Hsp70 family protein, partial [Planctomycetota bacterium]